MSVAPIFSLVSADLYEPYEANILIKVVRFAQPCGSLSSHRAERILLPDGGGLPAEDGRLWAWSPFPSLVKIHPCSKFRAPTWLSTKLHSLESRG